MSEEKKEVEVFEETSLPATLPKIPHRSLTEMQELEDFRKKLVRKMKMGPANSGAHYGNVEGIKDKMVFKEGISFIKEAFYLLTGDPIPDKDEIEIITSDGTVIKHWIITMKVPFVSTTTGKIVAVGIGSCSTLESKYRYRGESRKCPECGEETIIEGKAEYGGGWLCWKKRGGCGKKFTINDEKIISQPLGKIENKNPIDVLDTVFAMAEKRAEGRKALDITGMRRYFRLPPDIEDEGREYTEQSQEDNPFKNEPPKIEPEKKEKKKNGRKPTKDEREKFYNMMLDFFGKDEKVEIWLDGISKGRIRTVSEIQSIEQYGWFRGKWETFVKEAA